MSDGPILFHNVMRISEGHLTAYRRAIHDAVEFVEEHGPQIMVQTFIDEAHMLGHSLQLYPDSAAILRHWELSDPYIQDVMAHCVVQRLDVFGQPNDDVRKGLASAGNDMPVSILPRFTGFLRRG